MSDIQRGITFTTSIPDAASAHALVDAAVILPAFISAKTVATPTSADAFVFLKNSVLRQCTLAGLISSFPQGGAASVFALRKLGTAAETAAAGNDPRFPARLTGIRKANGASPDTVANAADLALAGQSLVGITQIDWAAHSLFSDSLTVNKTYTFANLGNGRSIVVAVRLNGHTATFPAVQQGTLLVLGAGTLLKTFYFIQTPIGLSGFCIAS